MWGRPLLPSRRWVRRSGGGLGLGALLACCWVLLGAVGCWVLLGGLGLPAVLHAASKTAGLTEERKKVRKQAWAWWVEEAGGVQARWVPPPSQPKQLGWLMLPFPACPSLSHLPFVSGDKSEAKALMAAAGVPVVPGYHAEDQSEHRLQVRHLSTPFLMLLHCLGGGSVDGEDRLERRLEMIGLVQSWWWCNTRTTPC